MTDPVRAHAVAWPDAPAVVTPDAVWTWRDLERRVAGAATALAREAEAHPALGRAVSVVLPTTAEAVAVVWGARRAGVVLVPLSPRWPAAAVDAARDALGLARVHAADSVPAWAAPSPDAGPAPDLHLARRFTVVHTSGTTGAPRAAVHTVGNHVDSARGLAARLPLAPADRWLLDLPLAHVGGLGVVVRCGLAGAALAVPERSGAADALAALAPTHVSWVPTQLHRALAAGVAPPPSLRAVLLGGAAVPPALLDAAVGAGWPVATSYGLTEMTSTVTATAAGADREALATSGAVLPGRAVRLAEGGEIVVSGATLFAGYLDGERLVPPPAAGFATGDLGAWDGAGRLVVVGRIGNRFVSGGENVQPEAVEAALAALPGVAEAVVVPVPDAEWGARPVAFVRPSGGALPPGAALAAGLRRTLPGVAVPVAFLPWAGTDGMKPDRRALAAAATHQMGHERGTSA